MTTFKTFAELRAHMEHLYVDAFEKAKAHAVATMPYSPEEIDEAMRPFVADAAAQIDQLMARAQRATNDPSEFDGA